MTDRIDTLKSLYAALVDTRRGYEQALEHTAVPAHRSLFEEAMHIKSATASRIAAALRGEGVDFDADGSLMGFVHETVVFLRGSVAGVGEGMFGAMVDGERQVAEKFDAALAEMDQTDTLHAVLENGADEQAALIGRLKTAREAEEAMS